MDYEVIEKMELEKFANENTTYNLFFFVKQEENHKQPSTSCFHNVN